MNSWTIETLEFAIKNNVKIKVEDCCSQGGKVEKIGDTYYCVEWNGNRFEIKGWMCPKIDWSDSIERDERRLLDISRIEAERAPKVPDFTTYLAKKNRTVA